MEAYDPKKIEPKWQAAWSTSKAHEMPDTVRGKDNYLLLTEFPYPSGNLHIGHWYAFALPDIRARYLRMTGKNVLYPIGFDAFGLPAENAAIKRGINPRDWTQDNIAYMSQQLRSMGATFDWSRVVSTIDPEYYRWTQWMFLKMYEKGLAYRAKTTVNWCPKDKTVLANEQVVDGRCERCDTPVEQKEIEQWMFKITQYADRLIDDMRGLDWPETTKVAQQNWIGRSEGAKIKFLLTNIPGQEDAKHFVEVFTTRADTLFGVTAVVISPEVGQRWLDVGWQASPEVKEYIKKSLVKQELDRLEGTAEKTGVPTGISAINPGNNAKIPVWVADYVLRHYGTGAVMMVPAHDERDFAFATKFNLPITPVIRKERALVRSYLMGGADMSDDDLTALGIKIYETTPDGDRKIEIPEESVAKYEELINKKMTPGFWNEYVSEETIFIFKNKDSSIQRLVLNSETEEKIDELAAAFNNEPWQRSSVWGWLAKNKLYTDLIIHTEEGVLINSGKYSGLSSAEARKKITADLQQKEMAKPEKTYRLHDWVLSRQRYWGVPIPMVVCEDCGYQPIPEDKLPVELPELDDYLPTTDGQSPLAKATAWVEVTCPHCGKAAQRETDTMDTFVDSSWYFMRYTDPTNAKKFASQEKMKQWLPVPMYIGGAEHNTMHLLYSRFFTKVLFDLGYIHFAEPFVTRINRGIILGPDGQKMSKSRGNVVDPDAEVAQYGADTVRLYLSFMAPYEHGGPWDPQGIKGVYRFLRRVWKLTQSHTDIAREVVSDPVVTTTLHQAIKKVGHDIDTLQLNTAVSELMKLLNVLEAAVGDHAKLSLEEAGIFLKILAPFAPHIAEELWQSVLGQTTSIHAEGWPAYDEALLVQSTITIPVQVNGKVRASLELSADTTPAETETAARALPNVAKYLEGNTVVRVVYVPKRLLNFVIKK